jgi:hypothetical protein
MGTTFPGISWYRIEDRYTPAGAALIGNPDSSLVLYSAGCGTIDATTIQFCAKIKLRRPTASLNQSSRMAVI